MKNWGSTGIAIPIILIVIMLAAVTAVSVITGDPTSANSEENIDQMTQEVFDELSTYIQIKDQKGKYLDINGHQKIEKIALLISPLVSQDIDLSQLTIMLDNAELVKILYFDNKTSKIINLPLFEHSLWNELNGENYGLISIVDLDESITEHNVINDNSDNTYLVFKLPPDMYMNKYDTMKVSLFPSTGITRTTILIAPIPMSSVVTFE